MNNGLSENVVPLDFNEDERIQRLRRIRDEAGDEALLDEERGALQALEPQRPQQGGFYANLAEQMPREELVTLAYELIGRFEEDYNSRKEWQERERFADRKQQATC